MDSHIQRSVTSNMSYFWDFFLKLKMRFFQKSNLGYICLKKKKQASLIYLGKNPDSFHVTQYS